MLHNSTDPIHCRHVSIMQLSQGCLLTRLSSSSGYISRITDKTLAAGWLWRRRYQNMPVSTCDKLLHCYHCMTQRLETTAVSHRDTTNTIPRILGTARRALITAHTYNECWASPKQWCSLASPPEWGGAVDPSEIFPRRVTLCNLAVLCPMA